MTQEYFDPVMFIREGEPEPVPVSQKPFFCNIDGATRYYATPPSGVTLLEPTISDPSVALGRQYQALSDPTEHPYPQYGEQTRLEFLTDHVVYQPLWATRQTAAAFGMTLLEAGQGIRISSPQPQLMQVDYEYGMFAGHWSPYLGTDFRLLGKVCTDLEHHDFPHVFRSVDPHLPLVISVARYWPQQHRICLADLWLPRGKALYVPPRPSIPGQTCLDLHGNRNSALACWQGLGQTSVHTQTLLQTDKTYFYWFWNELPTTHPLLDLTGTPPCL